VVGLFELHSLVDGDDGVVVHLGTLDDVGSHHLHHLGQLMLLDPVLAFLDDCEVDDIGCHVLEELECCWLARELGLLARSRYLALEDHHGGLEAEEHEQFGIDVACSPLVVVGDDLEGLIDGDVLVALHGGFGDDDLDGPHYGGGVRHEES
jgi:hypothetical protein